MELTEKTEKNHNVSHVQSVEKALHLLGLLAQKGCELSLTEISKIMGWPKSTTHGILTTLRDYNYVEQSMITGHYKLGLKLFELGNAVSRGWDIRKAAMPYLQELNRETGEMVQLGTESDGEVLYLEKVDSSHVLRIVSDIGMRLPMHCTGLGKVLLAYKPSLEIKRILNRRALIQMTSRTITDRTVLEKELVRVRSNGYGTDDREIMDGIRCVAAPIRDQSGRVNYAVSVSGMANNMQGQRFDLIRNNVIKTADEISFAMGYRKDI